jgi:nitronate monooxygenase
MTMKDIPTLKIGNLEINPPIIQGGMGVRVSRAGLAAAVANEGCAGVIASVGLGDYENNPASKFVEVNNDALRAEIALARSKSKGIIGCNVMVVLSNYEDMLQVCAEENVDMVISGSGLPLDLPKFFVGKQTKLIPIVSSARALNIICRKWKQNYDRMPDAVIVEGPMAGGHMGYSFADVVAEKTMTLEQIVVEVVEYANALETPIPVIAAGGVFDGADIVKFLKLGASGVQMATRFVCTDECDVDIKFKQAYLDAKEGDITIINSPVGLPGRVLKSQFVDRVKNGETVPFKCRFRCLRSCDPKTVPYCIAKVLGDASRGDMENAFVFAGSNAWRCTEIVPVKTLVDTLKKEMLENL